MKMLFKNIALALFLSLFSFGTVMQAANSSFRVVVANANPVEESDEDNKKKNCTKILKEAAKKQCVKTQQEEVKKKEGVAETEKVVIAKPKPLETKTIAKTDLSQEDDEELITPMFGRTLYNFLKSLML